LAVFGIYYFHKRQSEARFVAVVDLEVVLMRVGIVISDKGFIEKGKKTSGLLNLVNEHILWW